MTHHTLLSALIITGTCTTALLGSFQSAHALDCVPAPSRPLVDDHIPAEAPGIAWFGEEGWRSRVILERLNSAGDFEQVAHEIVEQDGDVFVREVGGMNAEATYAISDGAPARTAETRQTFTIAPMPSIDATGDVYTGQREYTRHADNTFGEECEQHSSLACVHTVAVPVTLDLPEGFEGWRHAMVFELLVDGQRYVRPDKSTCGPARFSGELHRSGEGLYVARTCQGPSQGSNLSEGPHTVGFRASLPGTTFVWESEEVTLSLDCSSGEQADEDGGCSHVRRGSPRLPATPLILFVTGLMVAIRRRTFTH